MQQDREATLLSGEPSTGQGSEDRNLRMQTRGEGLQEGEGRDLQGGAQDWDACVGAPGSGRQSLVHFCVEVVFHKKSF